ncbi:FHA domain-containing protein [Myxococcota bacterium]|nr:FHA domain-containing protein [Myxococcota bacterium]MBU1382384.1 FHA domain-containing protein [Myxococcota bacterium]MBU1499196.1 FHA domain-containing protein [Myxococcota bacterium]
MWYVIVYDVNGVEYGRVPLSGDQTVYLGSDPSNNLIISDLSLPPQAAFFYLADGYPVLDDGGTSVAIVDGYPITQAAYVTAESQIFIGSWAVYVYYDDQAAAVIPPYSGYDDPLPPPPPPGEEFTPYQEGHISDPGLGYGAPIPSEQPVEGAYDPAAYAGYDAPPQAASIQLGTDAVQLKVNKHLKLIAREGYLDGREFVLAYDGFFDIGRAGDVEIVIDDPSVSRVHARLKLEEGGTLLIQDLRSTNGTFINGVECKRDVASVGDRIRIGEIPLLLTTFDHGADGEKKAIDFKALFKSKYAIIALTSIFFLIAGSMVLSLARKNRPKKEKTALVKEDFQESLKIQVARLKSEAKDNMRVDKWDGAISKLKNALALAPDDKAIKEDLAYASFERTNYRIFQNALGAKNRMKHEDRIKALELFRQIDPKSQYHRTDMAPIIMDLKKDLARHYRDDGIAQYKAYYYDKAHEALCHYFELDSQLDDIRMEQKIRLDLKDTERRIKYKKNFHACKAKRFLEERVAIADIWAKEAKKAISEKYPKGIDEIIVVYFTGNPKDAILRLTELTKTYHGRKKFSKHMGLINDLINQFQSIIQGYESGETRIANKDIEGAKTEYNTVLNIDKQIIPGKFKSRYAKNIANRLASVFYAEGKKNLDLMRFEDAFEQFKKGLDMDPDDTTELRDGIKRLEERATELLADAENLKQGGNNEQANKILNRILKMTTPKSGTHVKAQKLLVK